MNESKRRLDEKWETIEDLWDEGLSTAEIAEKMGYRSGKTLYRYIKKRRRKYGTFEKRRTTLKKKFKASKKVNDTDLQNLGLTKKAISEIKEYEEKTKPV